MTENKKWVEGDLINHRCGAKSINDNPARKGYGAIEGYAWNVIPESVGMFSDTNDMWGKKIFGGDICTGDINGTQITAPITYSSGCFWWGALLLVEYNHKIKVCGNTTENPELLEEEG